MKSTSARRPARPTLGAARPRVTAGCRYGAMESALRPPLPTATRACGHPNPSPLDQRLRAKHHRMDPRKQTPGGRHQIGIPAGFKSESVAGFLLECVAGFIGNPQWPCSWRRRLRFSNVSPLFNSKFQFRRAGSPRIRFGGCYLEEAVALGIAARAARFVPERYVCVASTSRR